MDFILLVTFGCAILIFLIVLYSYFKYRNLYGSTFNIFLVLFILCSGIIAHGQIELPEIPEDTDITDINILIDEKPLLLVEDLNKATSIISSINLQSGQDEDLWRKNVYEFLINDTINISNNSSYNNLTRF